MNDILMKYLDDFCLASLDNIFIFSTSQADHNFHVKTVLCILAKHELKADIKKCEFSITCTNFLGFIVGVNSIKVNPDKIAVLKD